MSILSESDRKFISECEVISTSENQYAWRHVYHLGAFIGLVRKTINAFEYKADENSEQYYCYEKDWLKSDPPFHLPILGLRRDCGVFEESSATAQTES